MHVRLGGDPEFFLVDPDGKYVSAHDKVPGTKAKPFKLKSGSVQADGTAVEINIDPATTAEEFSENTRAVIDEVRKIVDKKYSFAFVPSIRYDREYYKEIPQEAKRVGCDPDFSFYNYSFQPIQNNHTGIEEGQAMAGGHLHVGWTKDADKEDPSHLWDCSVVLYNLEMFFEPVIAFLDKDKIRKRTYGKFMCFRPKSYGVEWRKPSNFWLRYPKLWPWIFSGVKHVMDRLEEGSAYRNDRFFTGDYSVKTINACLAERFPGSPKMPEEFE